MSILSFRARALIENLLFSGLRLTYHSLLSCIYYEFCETEICALLTQRYSLIVPKNCPLEGVRYGRSSQPCRFSKLQLELNSLGVALQLSAK